MGWVSFFRVSFDMVRDGDFFEDIFILMEG